MKYIREGRFGPPKCYKTGAVVSSYPRPMLVKMFDQGGLDIIPSKEITWCTPKELAAYCVKKTEELPPVLAVSFSDLAPKLVTKTYAPAPAVIPFDALHDCCLDVIQKGCPWKTIVFDSLSGMSDIIYRHVAAVQSASLADPRKWAANIGMKVAQYIEAMTALPVHSVFIAHSTTVENELTKEVSILPLLHSKLRDRLGGILSALFYQCVENGKPVLYTRTQGLVKGIGLRDPDSLKLPEKVPPFFSDIYGKSLEQ